MAGILEDKVTGMLRDLDGTHGDMYPRFKVALRFLEEGRGGGRNVVSGGRPGVGMARVREEEEARRRREVGEAVEGGERWGRECREGIKEIEEAFDILVPRWEGGGRREEEEEVRRVGGIHE